MEGKFISPQVLRVCIWTGPALVFVFMIGMIPLAGFVPPPPPGDSAQEIAAMYQDDKNAIRLGCVLMALAFGFYTPWGMALAALCRRCERGIPILTYGLIAMIAVMVVIVVLIPTTWGAAAFRPNDTDPDITRAFNDYGWFLLLFTWAAFTAYNLIVAAAILLDNSEAPVFPRWVGYFNIWVGMLFCPGAFMVFFKEGPFAFNGAIAFYVVFIAFFFWMVVMTVEMLKVLQRDASQGPSVTNLRRVSAALRD